MKVVLDANIIISALLGSKITLELIVSGKYEFYAPLRIINEVKKYKSLVCNKAGITSKNFDEVFESLIIFINVLDYNSYRSYIEKAKKLINDPDDVDYIACAMVTNSDFIWSNDKDFRTQRIIIIKSTKELIS